MIAQAAHFGFRVPEVAVPTQYFAEASSVSFRRALAYGLRALGVVRRYLFHRCCLVRDPIFAYSLQDVASPYHLSLFRGLQPVAPNASVRLH